MHIASTTLLFWVALDGFHRVVDDRGAIHPDLAKVLDRLPKDRPFLATQKGMMRSAGGLGNLMQRWTEDAKLPQCAAHGLRKACARRLAEAGATRS